MRKSRKVGFTLIEMLVVIVIVGILVALALPAATTLMKSGGVNGAAREVANTLGLARQYAITHRTTTYVVFPYSGTTMVNPGSDVAPQYQSYAVYDFGSGNYVSKWEHLPPGAVFMNDNALLGPPAPLRPCLDNLVTPPLSIPFPTKSSPNATLAYIQFKPWGTPNQSGTFTITEGFMNGNLPVPTSINAGRLANAATASVDSVVGRIQVTRP